MSNRSGPVNNTATIARNSLWFGMELVFNIAGALVTSIIVARMIGPQRLDSFNFVMWLTTVSASLGSVGLPSTTAKYMAEYLNCGERGVARSIYRSGLRLQTLISTGIACIGLLLVWFAGDTSQRVVSALLVVAIMPRMIAMIPSRANNAAELMSRNTKPALTSGLLNIGLTWFGLWIGWGLHGVAAGLLAGSLLEVILKLRSVHDWLGDTEPAALPAELKQRMLTYSGQGLVLMLLNVAVWDRSDMVILRMLNHVPGQLTFFSLSFNLTERLLMIPNSFGGPLGVTLMAQYGRNQSRLQELTVSGAKYTFLLALPLLMGMAAVSRPLVQVVFGAAYEGMIPVLAVASLMAIPKSLIAAPTTFLQTTEKQSILIWVGCLCGALDIGLDVWLTPGYGALGAAIANGIAQTAAAVLIWWQVRRLFGMDLRAGEFARIVASGLPMGAAATLIWRIKPGAAGLTLSIVAGALTWFVMLRLLRAINSTDAERLMQIGRVLPAGARRVYQRMLGLLTNLSVSVRTVAP